MAHPIQSCISSTAAAVVVVDFIVIVVAIVVVAVGVMVDVVVLSDCRSGSARKPRSQ